MKNFTATKKDLLLQTIKKSSLLKGSVLTLLLVLSNQFTYAQLTATGQLRTRTELRAGQGTLRQNDEPKALFTSQRTRLNIGYSGYRFKLYTSLQDVRVWGQDASTINRVTADANDGFLVHEAWGEIILNDTVSKIENLSLKVGRQEIIYDDQRLFGNLDWLQQGRRHDAAILKYSNKGWVADLGIAYNQNRELAKGTEYNGTNPAYPAGTNGIGTAYKSFQYLYLGKKFFFGDVSLLYFNDNFAKYTTTPPPAGSAAGTAGTKVFGNGAWSRNTLGAYWNATIKRKLNVTGSYYLQGGHDKDGRSIKASAASIATTLQVGRKLFIGPGVDYLSGDDGDDTFNATSETKRFDPLYGTPHKFWGTMDYFYVANGFGRNGLLNYFLRAKYNAKDNLTLALDIHGFESAGKLKGDLTPYLGTEFDFKANYNLTKVVGFEFGYSYMKATATMASSQVKNVPNFDRDANWVYFMVNIKPNFMAKK